jgi:hypothetical protein
MAGVVPGEYGKNIYTPEWNRKTYQRLEKLAGERLEKSASVLVDGSFIRRGDRDVFAALARTAGCRLIILRLNCPPETVRLRIESRAQDNSSVSDGTWEVYEQQSVLLEEPESEEGLVIQLDATLTPELMVEQVLKHLDAASGLSIIK